MIKAVIFDFDGTILDTETPWYHAFCEMYEQHGAEMTMAVYSKIIGTNSENKEAIDPYDNLEQIINSKIDRDSLKAALHRRHGELMGQQEVRPGIISYLKEAKKLGLKIGLASSSEKKWVLKYLESLGIMEYFETIMTANDVQQVKPDPELYLNAIKNLGVSSREALAIEDSPNGCKAAVSAGLYTLVFPHEVTELMEFPTYNLRLNSLEDKSLSEVIALMENA
jgi:putative hydrolase of the HAD superfamily